MLPQATLGSCAGRTIYREAVTSLPNIAFVALDMITLQQQTQFILKIGFLVVFRLAGNIRPYVFDL
jgi:hypothetical protein